VLLEETDRVIVCESEYIMHLTRSRGSNTIEKLVHELRTKPTACKRRVDDAEHQLGESWKALVAHTANDESIFQNAQTLVRATEDDVRHVFVTHVEKLIGDHGIEAR
jgi:hypothetical protein